MEVKTEVPCLDPLALCTLKNPQGEIRIAPLQAKFPRKVMKAHPLASVFSLSSRNRPTLNKI